MRAHIGNGRTRKLDEGLTLIELMVAMAISSLLVALVISTFVSISRSFNDQEGAIANSRMASTAMNETTRILRAGTEIPVYASSVNEPVFEYAGAEKIILRSFIDSTSSTDPAPLRVQFARNARNELVETRWTAYHVNGTYWRFNTTSNYARVIARSLLAPTASVPLFRYYTKDGAEITPATNASLSETQRRNIASVRVTMRVQADESGRVAPVTIQNLVGIPNLGVARVEVG